MELHLTSTAVLLGSKELADFASIRDKTPWGGNTALVYAAGCENVAVTGDGVLDGQGKAFKEIKGFAGKPVLIRFRACRNVLVKDVLLKDSSNWTLHTIQCRQMRVDGLRIDNIHRSCPKRRLRHGRVPGRVRLQLQHPRGDDGIALKTLEKGHPCRDIVITNCILSSHCAAIRLGPDALENIERVSVSNCVIRDTSLNGIKIQACLGSRLGDLVFSNIVMERVAGPISLRLAGGRAPSASAKTPGRQGNSRTCSSRTSGRVRRSTLAGSEAGHLHHRGREGPAARDHLQQHGHQLHGRRHGRGGCPRERARFHG